MDNQETKVISAIVQHEDNLEHIVNLLEQSLVARHELSIQGSSSQIAERFGTEYINPEIIQKAVHPPIREPFLSDDFGYVLGLTFAVPVVIGAIMGLYFLDIKALRQYELLYVVYGALFGTLVGSICSRFIGKRRERMIKEQERMGGFVLWISTNSNKKVKEIVKLLKKNHARHILIRESE